MFAKGGMSVPDAELQSEVTVHWISSDWLEEHLNKDTLIILDVQPSIHDYVEAHIPGAVYLSEGILRVSRRGIPSHFCPSEAMQANLRQAGIRAAVPVVVYTGTGPISKRGDGLEQAHVAYALARFGHEKVYVLDGGLDKWRAEGRRLTKVCPNVEETDYVVTVRSEYAVELDELRVLLERPGVLLIDSRPADVYAGQAHWMVPGHIPGAINVPWTEFLDADNRRLLRPRDEIREVAQRKGISPDRTIVCYCGTGRKASSQFLILKFVLGYPDVRIYEASFTEWSVTDPDTGDRISG